MIIRPYSTFNEDLAKLPMKSGRQWVIMSYIFKLM